VKYADYFKQLQTRILEEVMPFPQNDTSPELRAYYQGQGDAAFFLRLRDFLTQRVSAHLSTSARELAWVHEAEAVALRKETREATAA